MKVVAVSRMFPRPHHPLSGVFVLEQLKHLQAAGIEVSVVCPVARRPWSPAGRGDAFGMRRSSVEGVPVTYVSYPHLPLRLSTRLESRSLVKSLLPVLQAERQTDGIDVLHAHQLFPTGYATVVAGRVLGLPTICSAHGSDVHTHPHHHRGIARHTRATLRMADRVVAVSQDLADRISRLEERGAPVCVVYNGVDVARFRPTGNKRALRRKLGLPEEGLGICFVGRLVKEKGVRELIDAYERLRATRSDVWLVLVGGGPMHERLAAMGAVGHGIRVAGPTPHERLPEYLNAADLFALASHGEGVPVSMLEAMACGLAVVASDVGGIPEIVEDGRTGLLVPPGDTAALATTLERLAGDADLRRALGERAHRLVASRFGWSRGCERLIDLYAELTAERGSSGAERQAFDA